jgi:hypothetical protein
MTRSIHYAICIDNAEYSASLEILKLYRVVSDRQTEKDGDVRVIDESGDDYLYPANYFLQVELPRHTVRVLNKSIARFATSVG